MTARVVGRDVLIVVCALSAGIHAALAPEHFRDGIAAGAGFLASAVLLGWLAVVLTRRPDYIGSVVATALVLAGLLGSYVLAVTTGVPLLHPEVEPLDGLALTTKAIETVGLLAAAHLLWRDRPAVLPQPKGMLT